MGLLCLWQCFGEHQCLQGVLFPICYVEGPGGQVTVNERARREGGSHRLSYDNRFVSRGRWEEDIVGRISSFILLIPRHHSLMPSSMKNGYGSNYLCVPGTFRISFLLLVQMLKIQKGLVQMLKIQKLPMYRCRPQSFPCIHRCCSYIT